MAPTKPDLPFCVFLDTEVYRAASFDWSAPTFSSLRERVKKGSIVLVTTDIVKREVRKGIRTLLNEFMQDIQKAVRHTGVVRCLMDIRIDGVQRLASHKIDHDHIAAKAEEFMAELKMGLIDPPPSAFKDVFDHYFAGSAPFGNKHKKSEFPDAANLVTLTHYARLTGQKIFVVSNDDDWKRTCEENEWLVHVEHLSKMIDLAIRAEWRSADLWSDEELLRYIAAKRAELRPMFERSLASKSRVNLGDGELDLLTLTEIDLLSLAVTDIYDGGTDITFKGELFHALDYNAFISIDDEEMNNLIEDEVSGSAELIARIEIVLPLEDPQNVKIMNVDYNDGLELKIPLK